MEMLLKIGEFAEMFDISIRALRLYDKIRLLTPEHTDEITGYRYYTADQITLLNTIIVLKSVGIRLLDIKHLVDNGIKPEILVKVLQKKQEYWENQIEIAKFNIENIKKINLAALSKLESVKNEGNKESEPDAYKMARLVCLENTKLETLISEALWL